MLNDLGGRNSDGGLWNEESLKKSLQSSKKKTSLREALMPDWNAFRRLPTESESTDLSNHQTHPKYSVGDSIPARLKRKSCSVECHKIYQELIKHPCRSGYGSFLHQI